MFDENSCELKLGTKINSLSKYQNKMIIYDAGSEDKNRRYWFVPCDVGLITGACSMDKGCQIEQNSGGPYPLGNPDKSVRETMKLQKNERICVEFIKKSMILLFHEDLHL